MPQDAFFVGLLVLLSNNFNVTVDWKNPIMILSNFEGVKVDFVKMSYPFLYTNILKERISMLDILDIAPMKLKAIAQSGRKKDFITFSFWNKFHVLSWYSFV